MNNKIIKLSILTAIVIGSSIVAKESTDGEFQPWYIGDKIVSNTGYPLYKEDRSKGNGGSLDAIDAIQDGVGAVIVSEPGNEIDYQRSVNGITFQDLAEKYGKVAKENNLSVVDQVLIGYNETLPTSDEIELAKMIKFDQNKSNFIEDKSPCDDNNPETTNDWYQDGTCVGKCDDADPETFDSFVNGECVFKPIDQNLDCDDGNPDTFDEILNGKCTHRFYIAGDECTTNLASDEKKTIIDGECLAVDFEGNICDDGNPDTKDYIENGECKSRAWEEGDDCSEKLSDQNNPKFIKNGICQSSCNDNNPLTKDKYIGGQCEYEKLPNGATCDDGQSLTTNDKVINGSCVGIDICEDGNPATRDTMGTNFECIHTPIAVGGGCKTTPWEKNNNGYLNEDGKCLENCDDGDSRTWNTLMTKFLPDGTKVNYCVNPVKEDGVNCDDGKFWTANDTMVNGECVGSLTCDDGNPNTMDFIVDGHCANSLIGDGGICYKTELMENNPAYMDEGECRFKCDDNDPSTQNSVKDGKCWFPKYPEGASCDDGNPFGEYAEIQNGECVNIGCDDHNPDTVDELNLADGGFYCTNKSFPEDKSCTKRDFNAHFGKTTIRHGHVVNGVCTLECDDNDPSTYDSFYIETDENGNENLVCINNKIPDGQPCAEHGEDYGKGDTYFAKRMVDGVCTTFSCDDGNPTTKDMEAVEYFDGSQALHFGCAHIEYEDGEYCPNYKDGNRYLFNSQTGKCEPQCDDVNPKTMNYWNPETNQCEYPLLLVGQVCDDLNPETINDKISEITGNCEGDNVEGLTCDDGDDTTFNDTYHNGICSGVKDGETCDDGDNLTINDVYTSGICEGVLGSGPCDDGNPQTINDEYDSTGVCVGENVEGQVCDDGNDLTINDIYTNGICKGEPLQAPEISSTSTIISGRDLIGYKLVYKGNLATKKYTIKMLIDNYVPGNKTGSTFTYLSTQSNGSDVVRDELSFGWNIRQGYNVPIYNFGNLSEKSEDNFSSIVEFDIGTYGNVYGNVSDYYLCVGVYGIADIGKTCTQITSGTLVDTDDGLEPDNFYYLTDTTKGFKTAAETTCVLESESSGDGYANRYRCE